MPKIKTLILAPHIDDELIGCFSAFYYQGADRHITIAYFYDLTPARVAEAEAFCRKNGHTSRFNFAIGEASSGWDEIYCPTRRDGHIHHKWIHAEFRKVATHFYSVDMTTQTKLPDDLAQEKKQLLLATYPSQAAVFADEKYWLFEEITEQDFASYRTLKYKGYKIKVLERYADKVIENVKLADLRHRSDPLHPRLQQKDVRAFDELVALCPRGKVKLTYKDGTSWEA